MPTLEKQLSGMLYKETIIQVMRAYKDSHLDADTVQQITDAMTNYVFNRTSIGISVEMEWYPSLKRAVWRFISEDNTKEYEITVR
jgi:hypothetical protein